MNIYWCSGCGIVWSSDEAPICRHSINNMVPNPPRVKRMEPIPDWHPYSPTKA